MSLVNVVGSMGGNWRAIKLNENFEHDLDGMRNSNLTTQTPNLFILQIQTIQLRQ